MNEYVNILILLSCTRTCSKNILLGGKTKMANEQNLIPQSKRTKNEQREIAKKGRQGKWKIKKKEKIYKRAVGNSDAVRFN